MKNSKVLLVILSLIWIGNMDLFSQILSRQDNVAVVEVDVIGMQLEPRHAGEMLRRELMKLNLYNVADSYDQQYILEKNNIDIAGCYSVYCLQDIAGVYQVDKILTGSVTNINKSIIITVKIFDSKSQSWLKMATETFNDVPEQLTTMMSFTLRLLLDVDYDKEMYRRLTSDVSFYRNVELMEREEANLSGPRLGVGYLTGDARAAITAPVSEGGADGFPVVSHIGYQFEKVFISSGNTHALVEFLPTLSGLEQGVFIPALNILLGVRNSRNGLEVGMGYNLSINKERKVNPIDDSAKFETGLTSGLLVAVGKTFKSGRLNFPVNIYYIPGKNDTHRFGVTFGFNIPRNLRG